MRAWGALALAAVLLASAWGAADAQGGLLTDADVKPKGIGERLRSAIQHAARTVMEGGVPGDIDINGPCKQEIQFHCKGLIKPRPVRGSQGRSRNAGTERRLLADAVPRALSRPNRIRRPVDQAAMAAKFDPNNRNRTQDRVVATDALQSLVKKYNITLPEKGASAPIARCLRTVMVSQKTSVSPEAEISDGCKKDIRRFFVSRAEDVRNDFSLVSTCAVEIKNLCAKVKPGDGRILACLKQSKQALSDKCQKAITTRQVASGQDIDLDPKLKKACTPDLEKYCQNVGWGSGARRTCLDDARAKKKPLTAACKTALYQRSLEDSEDIRFDHQLVMACSSAKKMFCDQIAPGRARVLECLESNMGNKEFPVGCKKMLQQRVARKSKDIRLDYRFRLLCRDDVKKLCPTFEQIVIRPWIKSTLSGVDLIECMRDHYDDIENDKCKQHMYAIKVRAADTPEYDSPLRKTCAAEIKELCNDIPPSESHTLSQCLAGKMSEGYIISHQCTTVLMKRLVKATEDFNLNPAVKKACLIEFSRFCKDPMGENVDSVECLRLHQDQTGFRGICKAALAKFTIDTMMDVRLVAGVANGCKAEMQDLCAGIEPGEGRVISCLQEKRTLITSTSCRDAVLHITGLAADDWRMDFQLYKNCKEDVDVFCAGVEPGQGRVHACLRANEERISPKCRMMERKMEEMESEDIRLSPRLKVCGSAVRKYCQDVPPGNAARITCLQDHIAEPDFPSDCHNIMQDIIEKSSTRFYLNPRVKTSCDEDVNRFCRWSEMENKDSDSSILGCLSKKITKVNKDCRRELVRTVRLQLWRYKENQPLTAQCDSDAQKYCQGNSPVMPFLQAGYVAECLMHQAGNLSPECWALISLPDTSSAKAAAKLEARYWHKEFAEEALNKLSADMHTKVDSKIQKLMAKFMSENQQGSGPLSILIICVVAVGVGFGLSMYYRSKLKGPFVIKDGNA